MLEVRLLGQFDVQRDGVPFVIPSRLAQSLLAYLVLTAGTAHRREKLAGLLWPDETDEIARRNLHRALQCLRETMESEGPSQSADPYFLVGESDLAFNPHSPHWLDVSALMKSDASKASARELTDELTFYRGDLLPGLDDKWVIPERERMRALFEQKMARLLNLLVQAKCWDDVFEWGERWIALGRAPEPAFRALMTAHGARGDRSNVVDIFERCVKALQDDLNVEPSPETRALFQQLSRDNSLFRVYALAGAPEGTRSRVTNLPIPLTRFIGRERECDEVRRLVSTTRLLTLTGSGGCGKTRLALEVAASLWQLPDGVWLVDLAPLADPLLVPQTVASVFDLRESSATPWIKVLQNYFHAKHLLLVLDNCEHLIQACAELCDTLLRACPDLYILATSREALNIAGETTFRVPSLSLPDPHGLSPLEMLAQSESVRLFVERANAVQPGFQLTKKNAPAVVRVVHRLDGIPLAIELAAARVKSLGIEEIVARLDDMFQLLTGGSRTALPRHQTLRAAMDWSYESLTEPERALFRCLGVFVGDWTLQAAEFMARDGCNVLEVHSRLVDKSLVLVKDVDDEGTRYRLLEPIRQYAQAKLSESGEAEQIRARHLDFCLNFADHASPQFQSAEQLKLLNRRRTEYENLRVALEWANETGSRVENSIDRPVRIIRGLEHLGDVYQFRDVGTQAITFYQMAIDWCKRLALPDKMVALRLHGKIMETALNLNWRIDLARFQAVHQLGAESQAILQAESYPNLPPHRDSVHLLTILSRAVWRDSDDPDWDAAERYARAAVAMAETLDVPVEHSTALHALSDVYFGRGLLRERVQVAFQRVALTHNPHFGNALERVAVLKDLCNALETVGEYFLALLHLKEAANLAEEIGAVFHQRVLLAHSAYCMFRLDRWDEILEILDQIREIQNRYPRERAGPECFPIAIAASVHARRGELDLAIVERSEAGSIMTSGAGSLERWARAQIH